QSTTIYVPYTTHFRSEGALWIVDAAQGVEAQTVANIHLAHKQGLTILPVINKIDLPNADIASVDRQMEEILAIPAEEAIHASAKDRKSTRLYYSYVDS